MFRFKGSQMLFICILFLTFSLALAGCAGDSGQPAQPGTSGPSEQAEPVKVTIGATANPHAMILEFAKPLLAEQGINLEIVIFNDYVMPNLATADGDLDANYFQHIPYLESFSKERNLNLVAIGSIHIEPMGIYAREATSLEALKDGAIITIPNDPTNGGRALLLLQSAGLIKLKEDVGLEATSIDVIENPHNFEFKMIDAPMLPRSLDDDTVTASVINSNFALEANLNPVTDSIFIENADSPYVNILVAGGDRASDENLMKVVNVLQTPDVRAYIEETFQGAVIPAF